MAETRIAIVAELDLAITKKLVPALLDAGFTIDNLGSIPSIQMAIETIRKLSERDKSPKPNVIIIPHEYPDDPQYPVSTSHLVRGIIRQFLPQAKIFIIGENIPGCDGVIDPLNFDQAPKQSARLSPNLDTHNYYPIIRTWKPFKEEVMSL